MAGSVHHIYDENGNFTMNKIENMGDAHEALEHCYHILKTLYGEDITNIDKGLDTISDGHHTFEELYAFRRIYNMVLFNEWARQDLYEVHKSKKHFDGELCFGDGNWFIVIAMLPTGQISNHYEIKYWDSFKIPETETALYPYDGHTGKEVMERLEEII